MLAGKENVLVERVADADWGYRTALGSHRVLIEVKTPSPAAEISLSWRRRDSEADKIAMRLIRLEDNEEIFDVLPVTVSRTRLTLRFRGDRAGLYALYWLPLVLHDKDYIFEKIDHLPADWSRADEKWLAAAKESAVPAEVIALEARNAFERFGVNEMPASEEEFASFKRKNGARPFALFGEDRDEPMFMTREIPYTWAVKAPCEELRLTARPMENRAFQLCVYAFTDLHNLRVEGAECLNTAGRDWMGKEYVNSITVEEGRVQTLWCTLTMPETEGKMDYAVTLRCDEGSAVLPVRIDVRGERAENGGEDEPEKFTRLGWLNSAAGIDDGLFADYPAVKGEGADFFCEGRRVRFDALGLPCEIASTFSEDLARTDATETKILASPVRFTFDTNGESPAVTPLGTNCRVLGEGACEFTGGGASEDFDLRAVTRAEADGHLDTVIRLSAKRDVTLDNIALSFSLTEECAVYGAGFGLEGGWAPKETTYRWNEKYANNMFWLGGTKGGLQVKFKHTQDVWECYNYRTEGLPDSWACGGEGDVRVENGTVTARCGHRTVKAGESFDWRFALLITPLKKRNMQKQWAQRYYHIDTWDEPVPDLDKAHAGGATVVNLHQGGTLNAFINYPFLKTEEIKAQTDRAHELGMKYKLYYTVREISNHVCELPALMSLGNEVLREGEGFRLADHFVEKGTGTGVCGPWLKEHMSEGCVPAWQQRLWDGDLDCAVATTGLSRWHNYYIEGMRYLMEKCGVDGIYLDGVGYDREIMKRVRKTMDKARPGCLIDFHSGNNFHEKYGLVNPIMQYLELMPCFDRLWIGEGYDFDKTTPEYWLVEMTGIPFGLTGEMLGPGGGNQWKGMVFGMSCRMGWQQGGDPTTLWRAWDEMGLTGANMRGWWQKDCPVTADDPLVKVTVFENGPRRFIAAASWRTDTVSVTLRGAENATLFAPAIEGFQPEATFRGDAPLPIEGGKGWLMEIMEF